VRRTAQGRREPARQSGGPTSEEDLIRATGSSRRPCGRHMLFTAWVKRCARPGTCPLPRRGLVHGSAPVILCALLLRELFHCPGRALRLLLLPPLPLALPCCLSCRAHGLPPVCKHGAGPRLVVSGELALRSTIRPFEALLARSAYARLEGRERFHLIYY